MTCSVVATFTVASEAGSAQYSASYASDNPAPPVHQTFNVDVTLRNFSNRDVTLIEYRARLTSQPQGVDDPSYPLDIQLNGEDPQPYATRNDFYITEIWDLRAAPITIPARGTATLRLSMSLNGCNNGTDLNIESILGLAEKDHRVKLGAHPVVPVPVCGPESEAASDLLSSNYSFVGQSPTVQAAKEVELAQAG
jgi:hypothetical protein